MDTDLPTEALPAETVRREPATSFHTAQVLALPRPRMRGWFHLAAAAVSLPGAALWTWSTPGGVPRVGTAAFAWGVAVMFACSALLHLRRWRARTYERLFRLDHTGIFLAIGGTGVALGLLGLEGGPSRLLVGLGVVGAIGGIVVEWSPFTPRRGVLHGVYLTFGWTPVVLLPWLWTSAGPTTVVLLLTGGLLYTAGAIIVGLRRPDPAPQLFGYHEIFHLLVIAAVVVHGLMVADLAARFA